MLLHQPEGTTGLHARPLAPRAKASSPGSRTSTKSAMQRGSLPRGRFFVADVRRGLELAHIRHAGSFNSSRVIDDHLDLRHRLKREAAAKPPDAAVCSDAAAERQVDLPVGAAFVDIDDACRDGLGEAQGAVHVSREDADAQAIFAVERERHRLVVVVERENWA